MTNTLRECSNSIYSSWVMPDVDLGFELLAGTYNEAEFKDELTTIFGYLKSWSEPKNRVFTSFVWDSALPSTDFPIPELSLAQSATKKIILFLSDHTSNTLTPTVNSLVAELEGYLQNYTDGWDGEGSKGPSQAAIQSASTMISAIPGGMMLPTTMLSSNGDIGLYWDMPQGYADVNFDSEGKATFFSRAHNGNEQFEELDSSNPGTAWYWSQIGIFESLSAAA